MGSSSLSSSSSWQCFLRKPHNHSFWTASVFRAQLLAFLKLLCHYFFFSLQNFEIKIVTVFTMINHFQIQPRSIFDKTYELTRKKSTSMKTYFLLFARRVASWHASFAT